MTQLLLAMLKIFAIEGCDLGGGCIEITYGLPSVALIDLRAYMAIGDSINAASPAINGSLKPGTPGTGGAI